MSEIHYDRNVGVAILTNDAGKIETIPLEKYEGSEQEWEEIFFAPARIIVTETIVAKD